MTSDEAKLFRNATEIAERRIRRARAMQAAETRDAVRQAVRALTSMFRSRKEDARRSAEA